MMVVCRLYVGCLFVVCWWIVFGHVGQKCKADKKSAQFGEHVMAQILDLPHHHIYPNNLST